MSAVILYRTDPSQNMRRYYRLDVQPDLFGVWLLIREWGRIGRAGQTRVAPFATIEEAHSALQRQQRAKEKRGYAHFQVRGLPLPANRAEWASGKDCRHQAYLNVL
jgi:predicted DNA-binding WGR domain protein